VRERGLEHPFGCPRGRCGSDYGGQWACGHKIYGIGEVVGLVPS